MACKWALLFFTLPINDYFNIPQVVVAAAAAMIIQFNVLAQQP
jgi:hypothetical protein